MPSITVKSKDIQLMIDKPFFNKLEVMKEHDHYKAFLYITSSGQQWLLKTHFKSPMTEELLLPKYMDLIRDCFLHYPCVPIVLECDVIEEIKYFKLG